MFKLFILLSVFIGKTLLCKLIWLGGVLLLFWFKGKLIKFDSNKWDDFLSTLTPNKAKICAVIIYLFSNLLTSALSYLIFDISGFTYGLPIAVIMFIGGALIFAYRWNKNREAIYDKYAEMQKQIKDNKE